MKRVLPILSTLAMITLSFADEAEVKVKSKMNELNENQAIVISKQKINQNHSNEDLTKKFEIVRENADIEGDEEVTDASALSSWKQACNEWKKEVRDLNKSNSLIHLNCGKKQKRSTEMGKKQFYSEASFTAKVQVRN